jgi:stage IV sporulation protein FB
VNLEVGLKILNIRIDINPFLFLVLSLAFLFGEGNRILILEVFILLHELTHVITAKFFNSKTKRIVILPIGVKAFIDMKQMTNFERLIVYISGPIFNMIICVLVLFAERLFINLDILGLILEINFLILFLNIIPIKPLDGWNIINCCRK